MSLSIAPLFSSSSGNCTFICSEKCSLLVDAGLAGKYIEQALSAIGRSPAELSAILVTHDLSEAISLADRILVLSGRPAHLKKTVYLHFAYPDGTKDTPLLRRNAPEFKTYFNLIWKELNQHEHQTS